MSDLGQLLAGGDSRRATITGVVSGIVTQNQDPDGYGRVRVRLPWLADDAETWWARVATPMAGPERGLYMLPEVDDEVLVAFEHGDPSRPVVIGSLWNGEDAPPEANDDGENNMRTIKSRSGHIVRLDDTDGAEKIEVIDKAGTNTITIDSANNSIAIAADGDVSITAGGKLTLTATDVVEITTDADAKVTAKGKLDLEATGDTTVKGAVVKLN
jgi:phage baseplate assembly protein V